VEQFLREREDDDDCQQRQFDDNELMSQSNDGVDQDVDHNVDQGMINDDGSELTRNDDDLLLEMENCIN